MTADRPYHVLFLCTGNSARSIIAESLLRHWGGERFVAHSAGSHAAGQVQSLALTLLEQAGLPTDGLRSKGLEEFLAPDAPPIDFVITVCDHAAEHCPTFPGRPVTAHWGIPDPAAVDGSEAERCQAYRRARADLERRIKLLLDLPLASLDRLSQQRELRAIANEEGETS